jgi:hypothetical protein
MSDKYSQTYPEEHAKPEHCVDTTNISWPDSGTGCQSQEGYEPQVVEAGGIKEHSNRIRQRQYPGNGQEIWS